MNIAYRALPVIHGTGEILSDFYDWVTPKLKSSAVALELNHAGRSQRMFECGSCLEFVVSSSNKIRLYRADFCKDRMCPSCQKRRSLVLFHQVKSVCCSIQNENPTFKYLLLTLTVPNVKAEQLSDEIKHMMKSWKLLTKRKEFKSKIKGSFRALEITYNKKRDDYHPHFHVLLCVAPGYFAGKNYITQARWLELWQEATRYPHITQVDIRAIKPNTKRGSDAVTASAAEVAKYSTKPADYVTKQADGSFRGNKTVINDLARALLHKRLVAFGGLMKEHAEKLKLADVDDKNLDLINIDGEHEIVDVVMRKIFRWNVGLNNYIG